MAKLQIAAEKNTSFRPFHCPLYLDRSDRTVIQKHAISGCPFLFTAFELRSFLYEGSGGSPRTNLLQISRDDTHSYDAVIIFLSVYVALWLGSRWQKILYRFLEIWSFLHQKFFFNMHFFNIKYFDIQNIKSWIKLCSGKVHLQLIIQNNLNRLKPLSFGLS